MKTATIILPLPDRKLSPNARIHWRKAAPLIKAHRVTGNLMALKMRMKGVRIKSYTLHFFWPDKRRRDRDNAVGNKGTKAFLDGIADTTGQNDSEWNFDGVRFELDRENPRLEFQAVLEEIVEKPNADLSLG